MIVRAQQNENTGTTYENQSKAVCTELSPVVFKIEPLGLFG